MQGTSCRSATRSCALVVEPSFVVCEFACSRGMRRVGLPCSPRLRGVYEMFPWVCFHSSALVSRVSPHLCILLLLFFFAPPVISLQFPLCPSPQRLSFYVNIVTLTSMFCCADRTHLSLHIQIWLQCVYTNSCLFSASARDCH